MPATAPADNRFSIGPRAVGSTEPCFIVAEVAQAHDGSLGAAHAYIDAAARAGADAVKFQTHIAEAESTAKETFRIPFSRQDASRIEYWKRTAFSEAQWAELVVHASDKGLVFLSSPFSVEAADLLERLAVPAWKIGSGEITNIPLLERVGRTKRPVLLSSGLASWSEVDAAVRIVRACGAPAAVFHCTSEYPCPPERVGLNNLHLLRERFDCPVGLSDHSGTIFPGLAAVVLGANLLEVHVTFSRECFGPDVPASVTTQELAQLVAGVRFLERAFSNPTDKDEVARELGGMRSLFFKSIVARRTLAAGHRLTPEDVAFKKPGTGMPPASLPTLLGRSLRAAVAADHLFREDDFE